MTIRFACKCGQDLQASEQHAGRLTRCPTCGAEQTIPGPDQAIQPAASAPLGAPVRESVPQPAPREEGRSYTPREEQGPPATSGKAIASLICGLFSCTILAAIPAVILGIIALVNISRSRGRLQGQGLAIAGIILGVISGLIVAPVLLVLAMIIPAVAKVREAAARAQSSNNLRQIGIALYNHNDDFKRMPAAAIYSPVERPLLSWRVAILPYIEEGNLYKQFKLDEPWDSPHNIKLLERMPRTYLHPAPRTGTQPGYTFYRAFTGPGTAFEGTQGMHIPRDFPDGTRNTILVAEAADAVPWTKPDELVYGPGRPLPQLGGHFGGGTVVLLGDASVQTLPRTTSEQTIRDAITRNGGEPPGTDW